MLRTEDGVDELLRAADPTMDHEAGATSGSGRTQTNAGSGGSGGPGDPSSPLESDKRGGRASAVDGGVRKNTQDLGKGRDASRHW